LIQLRSKSSFTEERDREGESPFRCDNRNA